MRNPTAHKREEGGGRTPLTTIAGHRRVLISFFGEGIGSGGGSPEFPAVARLLGLVERGAKQDTQDDTHFSADQDVAGALRPVGLGGRLRADWAAWTEKYVAS